MGAVGPALRVAQAGELRGHPSSGALRRAGGGACRRGRRLRTHALSQDGSLRDRRDGVPLRLRAGQEKAKASTGHEEAHRGGEGRVSSSESERDSQHSLRPLRKTSRPSQRPKGAKGGTDPPQDPQEVRSLPRDAKINRAPDADRGTPLGRVEREGHSGLPQDQQTHRLPRSQEVDRGGGGGA